MKSFKEENQRDIQLWFQDHPQICLYLSPVPLNVVPDTIGSTYRYKGQSILLRQPFNQEPQEHVSSFGIEFLFENINLRQVLLVWHEGKNSAAADITHWTDKHCCKWIVGVLRTVYGKSVIWPYETEMPDL